MSVGQQIAVAAGAQAEVFDVIQHYGILPDGDSDVGYKVDTACARGSLLMRTSAGVASPCDDGTAHGANTVYLGFVEQDVLAVGAYPIELQYDYRKTVGVDTVTQWRFGRFRIPAAHGSINQGDLVYPYTGGLLSASQLNSATAVGRCVVGTTASGSAFEVEINLIGK